jgi:exodeoxyribonuclease-1
VRRHAEALAAAPGLAAKVAAVFQALQDRAPRDPELDLYGGFLSDADRELQEVVRSLPPGELSRRDFPFQDPRLPVLLFRYRARNWPESLAPAERSLWDLYRRKRLNDPEVGLTLAAYRAQLGALRAERADDAHALELLDALDDWGRRVGGD